MVDVGKMIDQFFVNLLKRRKPPSPRAMKFPYTFTAKIVQFPWAFYINNNWVARYYFIALFFSLPVMKKIQDAASSPANMEKWEEYLRKEREEHEHHLE